jgi:hypothetical protein
VEQLTGCRFGHYGTEHIGLEGVIKALTAISLFLTALLFLRIIPTDLKLPSALQFSDLNAALEARVNQRTAELEPAKLGVRRNEHDAAASK